MIDFNNKYVQIGVKAGVVAVGLLAVFLLSKTVTEIIGWTKDNETYPAKTITVSADGEAVAVADIASFTFYINEDGATSEEAQKKATDKTNKALSYLKTNGVEDKDIKTESYSIYPKYDSIAPCYAFDCPAPVQKIVGYTVSQGIRIKVRDTDNAGKFLGELTSFGINDVSGLSFTIDEPDALYDSARKDAIKKIDVKVDNLEKDLKIKIGKVISYSEDNPQNYPGVYDGYGGESMMKTSEGPSVPLGENKYTTRVYITYEIK